MFRLGGHIERTNRVAIGSPQNPRLQFSKEALGDGDELHAEGERKEGAPCRS